MTYPEIKKITRKLRNNLTPSEQVLWKHLRKKQIEGRKFLRQHAIIYESVGKEHFFYVPDFYCAKEKLAIELDGKVHDFIKKKDLKRDKILNDLGIKVLRIKNEDLQNIENIIIRIKNEFCI
jgi:very-short-patch-repair endonuclease